MSPSATATEFAELLATTFYAASAAGVHSVDRTIGGHLVRLVIAGPAMVAVTTGAFAHLAPPAPPAPPALTVQVWDAASSNVALPQPRGLDTTERFHFDDGRFDLHFDPHGRSSLLDRARRIAFVWVDSIAQLSPFESAAPLRKVIQGWSQTLGLQMVHAAGVGTGDGGALLVGRSGSGKSTTALACLRAGLHVLGDDYCLVDDRVPPTAHSLYCAGKLRPDAVAGAPDLAPFIVNRDRGPNDKALFLLGVAGAPPLARSFPLRCILIPRLHDTATTHATPATTAQALLATAPSTVIQLRHGGATSLSAVSALVRRVPCFHLLLGRDIARVPDAIRELLATLPS